MNLAPGPVDNGGRTAPLTVLLESNPFDYALQPILHFSSGQWRTESHELLIRPQRCWSVSTHDLVNGVLSLGLQREFDRRVLTDAFGLLDGDGQLQLSVNITADSLGDLQLARDLIAVLAKMNLDPGRLRLEITEYRPLQGVMHFFQCTDLLRDAGVLIGLDDVGCGWHTLDRSLALEFLDFIKIDRSMLLHAQSDPRTFDTLADVVANCRAAGLEAVIEGVETDSNLALIRRLGFDRAQGFYFGKPRVCEEITPLQTVLRAGPLLG